ncbi:MAG: LysM peptidoglycan-binding domain-containing protein [Deltaproteobacteria bacterium]|nr:LysM peptidoglycan-binding domain-containing protein [Deltaproteobacteria bacterium]
MRRGQPAAAFALPLALFCADGCAVAPRSVVLAPRAASASTPPSVSSVASSVVPLSAPRRTWDPPLPELRPASAPAPVAAAEARPVPAEDLPLEPSLFCVQVPDRQEVREVIAEFAGLQRKTTLEGLRRSGRYLPMMRAVFAEEGLPPELVYLSFVESHFVSDARSVSGAVGLWQFIDTTGRNYGLRIDDWVDERLDPEGATRAAARHLGDLYSRFGDWNLAVAAYNAGSGGVGRAVDRYVAESFWDLYGVRGLRDETCRYVVKFLAAVSIGEDPSAYGLDVGDPEPPLRYDTVWVEGPLELRALARAAQAPEEDLLLLNPALRRGCVPPGPGAYPLRVPAGLGRAMAREAVVLATQAPSDAAAAATHVVVRGDTLTKIARAHGTTVPALASANRLRRHAALRVGQALRLPGSDGSSVGESLKWEGPPSDRRADRGVHVVRQGDTVWSIARRYRVDPGDLLRWNKRFAGAVLLPGDRLVVARSESPR